MKTRSAFLPAMLSFLLLLLCAPPQHPAAGAGKITGGVNLLSILPDRICVGDTVHLHGAAATTYPPIELPEGSPLAPLVPLGETRVSARADLGVVTPDLIHQYNDGFYFDLTYKAVQPGQETLTLTLNDGLASYHEHFEVHEKCDYDAFLLEVLHFTADIGGEHFYSITHVTGTGTMKRDREGTQFLQGDGTWHLEEIVLSKPEQCVEYYMPPLIMHGPFELDGRITDEGDQVDVILSFQPNLGESFYHGETVCVDADGSVGYGWSRAEGGNPSLAAKINATFPVSGGSQQVEMEGIGLDMVREQGQLDYTATLTLIPR